MERTELMVGEGVNGLRAGRLSLHRPVGESRRVPDNRMMWKWSALMGSHASPPSIKFCPMRVSSDVSNAT
jgi:hypothetical protein